MPRPLFIALLSPLLAALASAASLTIQSPRFTITSSSGSQLRSETFSTDKPLSSPLTLGPTDVLKLTFTIQETGSDKPVQPHQTFLRFFDAESGEEGIQPVRVSAAGKAKFELNMARPPLSLPPTPAGTPPLSVSLLLGSPAHEPAALPLFALALPQSAPAPQHPDETSFHVQPEIVHTFRPAQTSPPRAVSAAFAVLVLAPWVVLLRLWSAVPHRLPHLLSTRILPFLALLGAFEGLLLWYWVDLYLGQVLAYGAVLGLCTAAAGNRALSAVAKWRLGEK